MTIVGNNDTQVYTGSEQSVTGYTYSAKAGEATVANSEFVVALNEGKEAGEYVADLSSLTKVDAGEYTIYVKGTNPNYTKTATTTAKLTITPRSITMTSATDSKVYDGKALTNSNVTVTGDGFAEGEGATYNVTGSQTLVGSSENTFTYTLKEGTKAGNYEIKTVFGTLTVTDGTPDKPVDPDLVVTKSHTGSDFKLGDTVTFNITATNIYEEPQTITLIEIDGVTLADAKATFPNVKGGDTIETTATYTITEADILAQVFVNTVTAKLGNIEKKATDTVTADEIADKNGHLTITKVTTSTAKAEDGKYALGETITYKITVKNDGNLTIRQPDHQGHHRDG